MYVNDLGDFFAPLERQAPVSSRLRARLRAWLKRLLHRSESGRFLPARQPIQRSR